MTIPQTVRAVRRILGATSYYRRHIINYSKLCEPLTELTKGAVNDCLKKITWTPACDQAFNLLKKALVNAPILHTPKLDGDYRLYCDASLTTVGAVLTQVTPKGDEKVCLFISHKLPPDKLKYSIQAKEAFAIFHAFKKLYHWIAGGHIDVFTDCRTLLNLFKASFTNSVVDRMGIYLSTFNARLIHLKGTKNIFADMLSRPNDIPDNGYIHENQRPKFFTIPLDDKMGNKVGYSYTVRHLRHGTWVKGSMVYPKKEHYSTQEQPWQINSVYSTSVF
ncbi:MAG: hypothetical protein GY928_14100, partial [Colwellia sp.]|nr:hypothetical protein [Colwellia sp.]